MANQLQLSVRDFPFLLELKLGGDKVITIPRRVTTISVQLPGFTTYESDAFVMDVPEGRVAMLGMPWFTSANPDIDWAARTVRPRASSVGLAFHQCVQVAPARAAGRSRQTRIRRASSTTGAASLNYIRQHGYLSARGMTRLVSKRKLRQLLRASDNEYCFFISATDDTVPTTKLTWENLVDNPVYPLAIRYKDSIFRSELPSVPPARFADMEATIELNDDVPVHRKQYSLSATTRETIRAWTKEMVAAKIIRLSSSPYCAPTFCVRKASGEWRIVHHFRGTNAKMRVPANPIPRKDDIYRAMASGRVFSAMDLLWGFYQVRLREDSVPYTAFATPDGLYEYLVAPKGVSSCPSCFNRLVQHVFSDQQDFCRTYFDDIVVFTLTASIDDHLSALETVFERCKEQQLFIKLYKCTFCAEEIPCLGDRIGRDGVRMDPAKTELIREWPVPQTKRELQSFLGTCVYVLRFCPDFAKLSVPLIELTKGKNRNDPVQFEEEHLNVFNELKVRLAAPAILSHPDFSRPFHVNMDASDFAIGGYLFQVADDGTEKSIAYGGRKLSRAEVIYPTREKELLAALHPMRLWKVYLLDYPFFININTDHKTIESLLTQQTCSQRLARWLNEPSLFQPRFHWVAGSTNIVADTISRNPLWTDGTSRAVSLQTVLQALTSPETEEANALLYQRLTRSSFPTQCRRHYPDDPYFGPIIRALSEAGATTSRQLAKFSLEDGLLFFQANSAAPRRLCIPADKDLRNQLLFEEHDAVTRGHPGQHNTRLLMATKISGHACSPIFKPMLLRVSCVSEISFREASVQAIYTLWISRVAGGVTLAWIYWFDSQRLNDAVRLHPGYRRLPYEASTFSPHPEGRDSQGRRSIILFILPETTRSPTENYQ